MSDDDDVIAANEAFYAAFRARDLEAIEAMWAASAPSACIHPGWDAIEGRARVLASFRAILEGGAPPDVRCVGPRAHVLGDAAFVTCHEDLGGGDDALVATNVFVREADAWKLVHHQAGPLPPRRGERARPKRGDLN